MPRVLRGQNKHTIFCLNCLEPPTAKKNLGGFSFLTQDCVILSEHQFAMTPLKKQSHFVKTMWDKKGGKK